MKGEKTVGKRRRHSAEFKAKVVLAALREDKTQSQLAGEFGIHPLQITAWKRQAVERMPEGFGGRRERTAAEQAELERRLYEKIGRLETELDWLKKKWGLSLEERRELIQPHPELSLRRQCELLSVHRSGLAYVPAPVSARELDLRARLDRIYTAHPEYGVRRMVLALGEEGRGVNPKCVRRLLRAMGLEAVYPKPRTTVPGPPAGRFPHLLRGLAIERPHQVWAADLTDIALPGGWAYLLAVMDGWSRYVLAWGLSATRDSRLGAQVWRAAPAAAGRAPEIMNTDQGAEFSSQEWIGGVQASGARVSQDGRGRALDNVMVGRLWRTVKWDHLYLHDYPSLPATRRGLDEFFPYYNERRWHQGLGNRTPHERLFGTPKKRTGEAGAGR